MPTTKKRDRTGYVMVHLDSRTKAKLEAIGVHWERQTGIKINKSDALRLAITRTYNDLSDSFQIQNQGS